jgi:hypothetical protein
MLISLGNTCSTRYNIQKFIETTQNISYPYPTLFFDWLLIDFNSVCTLFENYSKINNLLNIDYVYKANNHPTTNKSRIEIKSLSYCVSIHDVKIEYTNEDLLLFIEKYKNRFNRIINIILENKEKIYFVYKGNISEEEKTKFIQQILQINKNCNFCLVNLHETKNDPNELFEPYFIKMNLNNYMIPENPVDWTQLYYNWTKCFETITNK